MPRRYRKTIRAASEQETRDRIVRAAIDLLVRKQPFQVRDIAREASVTVQTVYSHFGSKGGLVTAVIAEVSSTQGLDADLERVRLIPDPIRALDEMITVTLGFWRRAWPVIDYSLGASRTDQEFASMKQTVDRSRLEDLRRICARLGEHGLLRAGLSPKNAAALVFTLTTPQTYEELVASGRMPFRTAVGELRAMSINAVGPKREAR